MGTRDLRSITPKDTEQLKHDLIIHGHANQTVNSTIELASTVINHAVKKGHYKGENPFKGIEKLPVNNKRLRYLTVSEVQALLSEVSDNKLLYLFTLLSLSTGARLAAITKIQVKDIHLEDGTITLQDDKGGETYTGFIKEGIKPLLEEHVKGRKPNAYVVSETGAQIKDIKRIQRPLQRILNRLFNADLKDNDRQNRVVVHTFAPYLW